MAAIECAHDAQVDTVSLVPNPRNPNKHPARQIELLAKIIKHTGWRNPIVVSNRSGFIVKGHARLEAAKLLGETQVPVDYQDYPNEAMEWADMVADNRIAELAEPSLPELKDILQELDTGDFDMDLTGFDSKALEELMTQTFQPKNGLTDDDEIPEPKETVCKVRDLWLLGRHRLLCGDSTKPEDVARLMGGEKADCVVTDPPYAIYGSSTGVGLDVADDNMIRPFFESMFRLCRGATKLFGHIYVCCDWRSWSAVSQSARGARVSAKNLLVWDKGDGGLGAMYQNCHEFVGFFANDPPADVMFNKKTGARLVHGRPNIVRVGRTDGEDRAHNAAKPVKLISELITNGTDENELVCDWFLGSGTTLIACEKLNRRCYGMEIDAHYCDVVIERWQNYTGQKAQRG